MARTAIRTRLLESRIEARESQLQLATRVFGCGFWTLEPATGGLTCSAHCLTLLGLPSDARISFAALLATIHADDRARVSEAFARTLSVRDRFAVEFRMIDAAGATRLLRCTGRPHASALAPDHYALSGVLQLADGTPATSPSAAVRRLNAMVTRLERLRELDRGTLVMRLQAELVPQLSNLRTRIADLAADVRLAVALRPELAAVAEALATWLDELRAAIFEILPPGTAELGFAGALERYASETAAAAGLQLALSLPEAPLPVPEAVLEALYLTARAGIDNVAGHAHARHMSISVECRAGEIVLTIADDGVGIRTADLAKDNALGLFASSERLASCGGHLHIDARPEGGTVLEASVAAGSHREPLRKGGMSAGRAA